MLGDQIGDLKGQAVSMRVLEDTGLGPRTEVTDHQTGTLCGVQVDTMVTYVGTMRPNGTLAGAGTGYVVTANGQTATFRGTGVGTFTGPGQISWRGALFYETDSEELGSLNGIAVLFEYQTAEGKSEGHLHEWK